LHQTRDLTSCCQREVSGLLTTTASHMHPGERITASARRHMEFDAEGMCVIQLRKAWVRRRHGRGIDDEDGAHQGPQGDFAEICGVASKHIAWAGRLCKESCLYNEDPFKSAEMIYIPHRRYIGQRAGQLMYIKWLGVKCKDRSYCRLKNIRMMGLSRRYQQHEMFVWASRLTIKLQ
jgi:hypothetical protein